MLIGVTGQIGAGKSAVSKFLARKGALVVDADEIGKQVTGSSVVLGQLVKSWGEGLRTKTGRLRPLELARLVFADRSGRQLERFNEIIREPLGKAIWGALRQAEKTANEQKRHVPVVLDAALLPDWEISEDLNLIVLTTATKAVRLERLLARGMGEADALARMGQQSPLSRYREVADVVIANNHTLTELEEKVERLWRRHIIPQL